MESLGEDLDKAVLASIITVLLVRAGGQISLTHAEWDMATSEDAGSLWIHRAKEGEPIRVVLMRKTFQV